MPGKGERRELASFKDETMHGCREGDNRWEGRGARGWSSSATRAAAFPEPAKARSGGARPPGERKPDRARPHPHSAGAGPGRTCRAAAAAPAEPTTRRRRGRLDGRCLRAPAGPSGGRAAWRLVNGPGRRGRNLSSAAQRGRPRHPPARPGPTAAEGPGRTRPARGGCPRGAAVPVKGPAGGGPAKPGGGQGSRARCSGLPKPGPALRRT